MASVSIDIAERRGRPDLLSGTPRSHAIDRWIYVFTAASFIAIVLAGFVPSSLARVAAVKAGQMPPFPLVLHLHALLMGSFLLLLLAQTTLVAVGRGNLHRQLGLAGMVLAPAMVVVGFALVPTSYHAVWAAAQAAPPAARDQLQQMLLIIDNFLLLQLRVGILFPLFLAIALGARVSDTGLHKRMVILATAMTLPPAIDRITWLPSTVPSSPLSTDLYTLLAVSPMVLWDLARNRALHKAYRIWIGVNVPVAALVYALWDTQWWHETARQLMGLA